MFKQNGTGGILLQRECALNAKSKLSYSPQTTSKGIQTTLNQVFEQIAVLYASLAVGGLRRFQGHLIKTSRFKFFCAFSFVFLPVRMIYNYESLSNFAC